jgi:hypothetical protein
MTILLALLLAQEVHVGPDGKAENAGTKESPWDLASAIGGAKKVEPGTTIWVGAGTYRGKFQARLAGTERAPIVVRAVPGARATILNSGIDVLEPSAYLGLRDLEIAGDAPLEKRKTQVKGSWPTDMPGTGGLNVHAGKGCTFINLVIHDNILGGVGWWVGSTDSEMHGCLIYNNGWWAPDRTHGHCIYAQNKDGIKTISACILSVPDWGGSYSMHAYGSGKAYVDNFVIEDNIAYERGPFLVGGGRPSNRIVVRRNCLHGIGMQIGYTAPENEDCEVRDNVIAGGKISIHKYKKVVDEGNVSNPAEARAILIPNKYDPNRAHVAVYNPKKEPSVRLDVSKILKPGEACRLMDPKDVWGKPVYEGKCEGETVAVPMKSDFAAFVLLK